VIMRYIYMEESPFWLASRGELHAAAKVLERTLGCPIVVALDGQVVRSAHDGLKWRNLFLPVFWRQTVMTTGINFIQSLVFFSIGLYMPVITTILLKNNFEHGLLGTAVIELFGLTGSYFSVRLVNRVGLRREAWIGFLAETVLLLFMGYSRAWLPGILGALLLGIFILFHTFGPAQNGISIAVLSYPTEIRGLATGFSYGIGRLGSVLGSFLFPVLLGSLGIGHTLELIAIASFAGLLIVWFIACDPTGETMEQTQLPLQG
ncbi:MAG: MFS transporter, partial [Alicyclobacillus sp.]|nr:MFS transporter [Alicyclobacillus sp.]